MKYRHLVSALLGIALTLTPRAFCQSVPTGVSYQGRLSDLAGHPLPAGSYLLYLRIWNSATNTSSGLIWSQQQTVPVNANGVFNVILGASGGLPVPGDQPSTNDVSSAFSEANRYVGVAVGSSNGVVIPHPAEIAPRQQILPTPFSYVSANGIPSGAVIMWTGSVSNVPLGWALCDGSNGTPDLRGRFIVGAGTSPTTSTTFQIGQVGGSENGFTLGHTLTIDEIPAHRHAVQSGTPGGPYYMPNLASGRQAGNIDANSPIEGTSSAGGGQPHVHALDPTTKLPPYYALAYIMKL